jgi:hypothetical protein
MAERNDPAPEVKAVWDEDLASEVKGSGIRQCVERLFGEDVGIFLRW